MGYTKLDISFYLMKTKLEKGIPKNRYAYCTAYVQGDGASRV